MKTYEQPAKISYFFGPGWRDLGNFIIKLWNKNVESSQNYYKKYQNFGLTSLKGIYWLTCSLSVVIYGTIFFIFISIIFSIFLSLFFVLIYLGFSLLWIFDRLYLKQKKIFTACPECKGKSIIPTYACPNCGIKHTNLTPSKYGILYRTCSCGEKLGTTFITGRKNYPAFCQCCGHPLSDRENVPICIPIVGGRSVGKTSFITAFSKEFIDKIAPAYGWKTEFYNKEKANIFKEINSDYQNGTTRMTARPQDINKTSSISFSFFLRGKEFKQERLIHIYDIAGEVFTDNNENEIQRQYEYCQGIIFILDPFSIPAVKNKYSHELQPADIAGMGLANVGNIIDAFMNKLREVTGISLNKVSSVPIAIVISKIDTSGLSNELGESAIAKKKAENPKKFVNDMDIEDYLCRKFLIEYGMESFVNSINIKFKNNRYFACSAIGHTRGKGEYKPIGVVEPMEWLFKNADSTMKKVWNEHKFGEVPLKMEEK